MKKLWLVVFLALWGCPKEEAERPAPRRFAAVKRSARGAKAAKIFCERSFDAEEKAWTPPPERPVPGGAGEAGPSGGWRWINLWASWCGPCLEEMPLLVRWQKAIAADGKKLAFELWSVDEEPEKFESALAKKRAGFPKGTIRWLRSGDDLQGLFESLGVGADSAIPVHALVDPSGDLRCVRVGAVSEGDYGSIKAILESS